MQEHRENQISHNHDAGAADNCGDRFYLQEELGQQQIQNAGDVIAQIVHKGHINNAASQDAEKLSGQETGEQFSEVIKNNSVAVEGIELLTKK